MYGTVSAKVLIHYLSGCLCLFYIQYVFIKLSFFFFSLNISKPELPAQDIFENKEGMVVSDYGKFGNLMIGETREIVFWIE